VRLDFGFGEYLMVLSLRRRERRGIREEWIVDWRPVGLLVHECYLPIDLKPK
jgi:hypothetical protein